MFYKMKEKIKSWGATKSQVPVILNTIYSFTIDPKIYPRLFYFLHINV